MIDNKVIISWCGLSELAKSSGLKVGYYTGYQPMTGASAFKVKLESKNNIESEEILFFPCNFRGGGNCQFIFEYDKDFYNFLKEVSTPARKFKKLLAVRCAEWIEKEKPMLWNWLRPWWDD